MMHQLQEFIAYFEDSGLADNIRENDLLFPLIESVHVLAIPWWSAPSLWSI
jgi:hypothetical protein